MSIQKKFMMASIAVMLVLMVITVAITISRERQNIEDEVTTEVFRQTSQTMRLLAVTNSLMQQQVNASMAMFLDRIERLGPALQDNVIQIGEHRVADLQFGGDAQALQFELVDRLTDLMGGTATLFSRSGDDFVRISTNVKTADGQRAVGTKLDPSGNAIKAIQNGEAFYGVVDILGNPYFTGYEPIKDRFNRVIGIAYVGYQLDLAELNAAVEESRVLKQGFVALTDRRGNLRQHSDNHSSEAINTILAAPGDDWQITQTAFDPWGYQIHVAYSENEISDLLWATSLKLIISALVMGGIVLLLIYVLLNRVVVSRVRQLIAALHQITEGEGDLTRRFNSQSKDEFGEMANEFDKLLETLRQTIVQLGSRGDDLVAASGQLTHIAEISSKSVQQQGQQTEQAATAVHEMSMTAQSVAQSAVGAESAAQNVQRQTRDANELISRMRQTIELQATEFKDSTKLLESLKQASNDISQVSEVINSIAEQTNLLSLNAAIEAARAGEHGRGFAVVADEVRTLAGRTQSSTGEIEALIGRLHQGVDQVAQLMEMQVKQAEVNVNAGQEASSALQKVIVAVDEINHLNSEIASAAEQQSAVSDEISRNVTQIRDQSETNAEQATQTRQAGLVLQQLAEQIKKILASYKT
ncbi:MAG TPA: Cache 3/Cache 2 fusion domain-containing protein [Methylophaga sp.]|nr:Cache 3/Cache 2 fusion domain-containing protein [Methylophaga sp.]